MNNETRVKVLMGLKKNARVKYIGPDMYIKNSSLIESEKTVILKSGTYGFKVVNVRNGKWPHRPEYMRVIMNSKEWKLSYLYLTCDIIEVAEKMTANANQ